MRSFIERKRAPAAAGLAVSAVVETVLDEFFGVEETSIYWAKFEHTSEGIIPGLRVCDL